MNGKAKPALGRFQSKWVEADTGCWEWQAYIAPEGYGQFMIDPKSRQIGAHRAAWLLFCGEIPEGKMVLHKCDNKICVNPDHLYIGDAKKNAKDAVERGRYKTGDSWLKCHGHIDQRGENHPGVKLTKADVLYIRESDDIGVSLANVFCVTPKTISSIRLRQTWSHV